MQRAGSLSSRCSAALQSAACPGVSRKASGRPWPSVMAWTLVLRPPRLTPIAWACAPFSARRRAVRLDMRAVDQHFGGRATRRRQRLEHLAPDALGRPADIAVVERLGRAVDRRRILPPATRLQHVDDAADHPPVIDPQHPARLVRQQRLQPRPLPVAQPKLTRHLALLITGQLESHSERVGNPVYGSQP